VGAGTALFVDGLCQHDRSGLRDIRAFVGEHETPVLGFGMPSPFDASRPRGDYWWAIVPVEAVQRESAEPVGLRATVGGAAISGILGRIRLLPELPAPSPYPSPDPAQVAGSVLASSGRPLVAVAMATHNPPMELFRRQIESIREQTHRSWVCVISDDASSPASLAGIVEVIGDDPRFIVSPSASRLGFYGNFERALSMVPPDADHVALCDQDDRWFPNKLETLIGELGSGALLAYSDMRIVDERGEVQADTYWTYRRNNHSNYASLILANTVTGAAALFDRALLDHVLPFPPAHAKPFHDHWIAQVAMTMGELRYVDRPLYDYVQHEGAALGHHSANASGRLGSPRRARLGPSTSALVRGRALGWRRFYFEHYCRLALAAKVLQLRCGTQAGRSRLRVLRRIDRGPTAMAWLAARSLRSVSGATETLGREQAILAGMAWRRGATLRSRWAGRAGRRTDRRLSRPAAGSSSEEPLVPILVDYFTRDGSTLMMRLLASSDQIAVDPTYPFERKYFAYMWRWASLLDRREWPEDLWSNKQFGSLEQFDELPIMGPPPWSPRVFLEPPAGELPLGEEAFGLVWSAFSQRLRRRLAEEAGDSRVDVRYIAEKHLNTWAVDLDRLPPSRVIVLLRDPRDSWVSSNAFSVRRGKPPFGRENATSDEEHLHQVLMRQKHRLRWIIETLEEGEVPVVRYTDMVHDLPGVAERLGAWLEVDLDAAVVLADEQTRERHRSSASPEASIGRWRTELEPEIAERMTSALSDELRELGFD
jgi:hypothetical protein